ncbi:helix-turn-helix domain-containing protein [Nocardia flavorosea]|uniref:helix-turn-helix domain-containing protein n=1 Tax=Nocardia flavorosea TaxID=53429 RepID=UPI002B4B9457|nr:helix-turn-helix domain-containing protein [Nocardia flavorosea]
MTSDQAELKDEEVAVAAAIREVSATGAPAEQLAALQSLIDTLGPSDLREALRMVTDSVASGDGVHVAVFGDTATCTPADAATRLGMSRTHLYKLLDKGVLPYHNVGRDRRLYVKDVFDFAAARDRDRHELAERFARMDQDNNAALEELMDEL